MSTEQSIKSAIESLEQAMKALADLGLMVEDNDCCDDCGQVEWLCICKEGNEDE